MRHAVLGLGLVLMACPARSKPPVNDSVTVDSAAVVDTGTVFDTSEAGREALDSLKALRRRMQRTSSQGASVALEQILVDTLPDTTSAEGYSWVTWTERTIRTTVDTALRVVATDTITRPPPPVAYPGRPFGSFNLMATIDGSLAYVYGPAPFTASITPVTAGSVCSTIQYARSKGMRITPFMTGGNHDLYKTGGKFDPEKWKAKMRSYNTTAIRNCVAAAVTDKTVTANAMIDEPEIADWGGVITKPMLDYLALYAKQWFPTLPMQVNHGAAGYAWRKSEKFTAVDAVNYQYRWDAAGSKGNPTIYRDVVFAQSKYDGVATSFSLNVLGGGVPDRDGVYDCKDSGQYGKSLSVKLPLCRMTPDQLRLFTRVLGTAQLPNNSVCSMLIWRYESNYMKAAEINAAFVDAAAQLKTATPGSCLRP